MAAEGVVRRAVAQNMVNHVRQLMTPRLWKVMVAGRLHLPFFQVFFVRAETPARAAMVAEAGARASGAEDVRLEDEVEPSTEDQIPREMPRTPYVGGEAIVARSGMAFWTDDVSKLRET